MLRSASAASVAGEAGVAKVDAPARTAHSVEYVLIDEQSTKVGYAQNRFSRKYEDGFVFVIYGMIVLQGKQMMICFPLTCEMVLVAGS